MYKFNINYLARKSEAGCNTTHGSWHKVVQIAISWCGELQRSEADIVQSFIVDAVCFIRIFYQLMDWQCSIVRLHNGVWYFWWWYDTECVHNPVRVFFSNFRNKKRSHARASTTTQGVCELKALKTITAFCLFTDDIKYRIYQLSSFGVMPLCPVVSSTTLTWQK